MYVPVRRYITQPIDSRWFERHGGVEAARDGTVDDGLPLLVQ